ncbi:hypothetical protein N5S76_07700 [Aliarcobacter cryaerophilus]|uniref:hypothetical protein n=1 Tax=Aliarcobacter cryaerophilus TaxID=28198 RepID=UPI0021B5DB7B|nr:hypothetical protein [Aliarcobacter cryaerophilus]MCT7499654.1 hypothetical protein [Aliarcobacter cryaerophilus]MCT7517609.1 hypothetical protein [Aliarcobacter cryaerophilus]
MEYFRNKGFLEAVITIFVSILASLSVITFNNTLFDEIAKIVFIIFFSVGIFVLIGIKAKEEQKNEEKIRNMLKEELAKLNNQDNNSK